MKNKIDGKVIAKSMVLMVVVIAVIMIPLYMFLSSNEEAAESVEPVPAIDYTELHRAYQENALRADDSYKGNRYSVTGTVEGLTNDGLLNASGGAMLTVNVVTDTASYIIYAEFEKEQEEALKTITVGDTITFEGECQSVGSWANCELVQ